MLFASKIKRYLFRRKWRKLNSSNFTIAENIFNPRIISVGNYTYGYINLSSWGNENERLIIGNFVSIASGVKFILGGGHRYDLLSTFPFKHFFLDDKSIEAVSKGSIVIADDVWIGMNCLILSGVTIGQGAIVGAGSVVVKDVPPYSIVGGNPARVLKFRFDDDLIAELLKVDYSKIDQNFIRNNIDAFYQIVDSNNINAIIDKIHKYE